jgi:tetratricopeptide (TPR) repeat protein
MFLKFKKPGAFLMLIIGFVSLYQLGGGHLCVAQDDATLFLQEQLIYNFQEPVVEAIKKERPGVPSSLTDITPKNDEDILKFAILQFRNQDYEKSEELFEQLVNRSSKIPVKENAFFYLGLIAAKHQHFKDSRYYFSEVVRYNPDNYFGFINLGLADFLLENYEEAKISFLQALAIQKNEHIAYFYLGLIKYKLGLSREASADLRWAKRFKDDHVVESWLDKMMKDDERYQTLQETAARPVFDQAQYFAARGWLYLDYGKLEEAKANFKKALEINPGQIYAVGGFSEAYLLEGNYSQSEDYAFMVLALDPNQMAMVYSSVGRIRMHAGRWTDAEEILNKAIDVSSPKEECYPRVLLGQVYVEQDQIDKALKQYHYCNGQPGHNPEIEELELKINQFNRRNHSDAMTK